MRSFSTPLFTFLLSIIGIKYFGKQSWGEFIYINTWLILAAFILNFGNKEYLIRKFSKKPSKISAIFSQNLISRFILIIIVVPFFFLFSFKIALWSSVLIFLIYIYQSFECLIIYYQKFKLQLIVELIGFSIITLYIISNQNLDLEEFLLIICAVFLIKIMIIYISFKKEISFKSTRFSIEELKDLIPFFLIILSGFLVSKVDLLIINIYLSKENIAEYQIGITSFLMLQSLAYLIILPFNKHIYRLKNSTIKKIKNKIAFASIPILIIGSIFIWYILEEIVHLNLNNNFYLLGFVTCIPIYLYVIDVQIEFKNNNENKVVLVSFIGAAINSIITLILIKRLGITGGLLGAMAAQFCVLILYKCSILKLY